VRIHYTQIYVQPGILFPFTHIWQKRMSEWATNATTPSEAFKQTYGEDWNLGFNVSAKQSIDHTEIRGPQRFKKDREVEFTMFLPYDVVQLQDEPLRAAVRLTVEATVEVLQRLQIDTDPMSSDATRFIEHLMACDGVVKEGRHPASPLNGGPAKPHGDSGATGGPPSVS
jgi:hypothetical protein